MSAPRYIIQLKVGDMTISRKLKTVLGDTEGLQHEIALILQENGFKSLADALTNKHGGLEAAQQKWHNDQLGECIECGIKLPIYDMKYGTGMFKAYYFCTDCK
jgi:hypothetical protein